MKTPNWIKRTLIACGGGRYALRTLIWRVRSLLSSREKVATLIASGMLSYMLRFGLGGLFHKSLKLVLTHSRVWRKATLCCGNYFLSQRSNSLCNMCTMRQDRIFFLYDLLSSAKGDMIHLNSWWVASRSHAANRYQRQFNVSNVVRVPYH